MTSLSRPARCRSVMLLGTAWLALAACGEDAPERSSPDAAAPDDVAVRDDAADAGADGVGDTSPGSGDASGTEDVVDEPDIAPPGIVVLDNVRITSIGGEPNFQNATGTVDLGPGPFSRVTMHVELGTTCYPFTGWLDNRPPAGHRWPADCDAFDRNFEVVTRRPDDAESVPGVELMRAITPFGGPSTHAIDVTDWANIRPGTQQVRVHITTWSDGAGQVSGSAGGWFVTLRFVAEPGPAPRRVVGLIPLLDTSLGADRAVGEVTFEVPEGAASSRLEYRTTGHGGGQGDRDCIGPAEEFCRRTHRLFADGRRFAQFSPWREDCDQFCTLAQETTIGTFEYCLESPCGAIQSVRAPRANWCPGQVTEPFVRSDAAFHAAGARTFGWEISKIADGGSWRTSAALYLYGE